MKRSLFLNKVLLVLAALTGAANVFASSISGDFYAYTHYHFDDTYYGKKVQAVYIHTGVKSTYQEWFSGPVSINWDDVRDVQLDRVVMPNGSVHFSKNLVLKGSYSISSGAFGRNPLGTAVIYYLVLEDGTTIHTEEFLLGRNPNHTEHLYYPKADVLSANLSTAQARLNAVSLDSPSALVTALQVGLSN